MRRRELVAATALAIGGAGCLGTGRCRGVALAIDLQSVDATGTSATGAEVLDYDAADLSGDERKVLERATEDRVVGCTRDDPDALEAVVERTAAHAGVTEHELYYDEGRARTPASFQGTRYRAVIVHDTAESSGGPLGA